MSSSFLQKRYDNPDLRVLETTLASRLRECPIPDDELLKNIGLFFTPGNLGRIIFMDFLYRKIIDQQGIIAEFGCRYGQNLALFQALRGIYEPYNRIRKIVGFDTFEGFVTVSNNDKDNEKGDYTVPNGYQGYLSDILGSFEKFSPLDHIRKFEILRGDVEKTLPMYLEKQVHTIFSLCYFDLDLYRPTLACLKYVKPRISKGTILAFDEINDEDMPGETLALLEALDVNSLALKRFSPSSRTSYVIFE
tara:strand:- start:185 stop:931 length:747 start_codon:yes stop_codon:yes gene_type:complete